MMIGVVATLKVQPDKGAEFERAFLDMAAQVKANEPGCLMYQLCRTDDPGAYKVLEMYASDEAMKAHGASEHFKAGGKSLAPFMAGRPDVERYEAVEG